MYTYKWQRYRLAFLRGNPLCVRCQAEGITRAATVVDHIAPHGNDPERFWDARNHQALCATHHNAKTATEDGGFGRRNDR